MEQWKKGSKEGRGRKQKEGKDSLLLVSFAAVFFVTQRSPKETAAHNWTTRFSIVLVSSLRSVEQTSHHITAKCEWRMLSREKACGANNKGFPAFVSRRTAVFAGYDHDERKRKCEWKPQGQVLHVLIAMFSEWENIYFLEMSVCKRLSRAESFLQIENRRKEWHSELAVNKSGEATWFLSSFI